MTVSDLLALLGWPALILILGGLLDIYSDNELKNIIVEYFRGVRPPKDISISLRLFLHGFLYSLLGERTNYIKFFVRSSLISIVVVAIVFVYQQYVTRFRDNCELSCHIQYVIENYTNVRTILVLLLVNCIIDYLANIVTVSLIELASNGCSILQFIITAGASLPLTVVIFTTIFPIGIVLAVLMYEATGPNVRINAALLAEEYLPKVLLESLKQGMHDRGFELKFVTLSPVDNYGPFESKANILILATKAAMPQREQLESAAQLMTAGREENSFLIGSDKSGWSAFVTVEDRPKFPTGSWLWAAYEAAFTAANLVREGFLGAIRYEEIDQNLYDFDRDLTARYQGPIEFAVKCKSTGDRHLESQMKSMDTLIRQARENCGGDVDAIAFFINKNSIFRYLVNLGRLDPNGSRYLSAHFFFHPLQ